MSLPTETMKTINKLLYTNEKRKRRERRRVRKKKKRRRRGKGGGGGQSLINKWAENLKGIFPKTSRRPRGT